MELKISPVRIGPVSATSAPSTGSASHRAFTLVELLAVMAIVSLLMALLVPATAGLLGTAGRKGAASVLLGAFEQARAVAIETSSPVYVYFWKRPAPQRDAYLIARQDAESGNPEFLTGWKTLPNGIIFYDPKRAHWAEHSGSQRVLSLLSIKLNDSSAAPPDVAHIADRLPQKPDLSKLAALKFNEFGAIEHPTDNPLALFIGEGLRDDDGREILTGPREESDWGGIDKLAFSRYTGRASLEISVGN